MWRDEKIDYLRKNRDYGNLLGADEAEIQASRSQNRGRTKGSDFGTEEDIVSRERQEYLDRRQRLKDLERQKSTGGKGGTLIIGVKQRREAGDQTRTDARGVSNRFDAGQNGTREKPPPHNRGFGSFFGPSEVVVAKRIIVEDRAREEAQFEAAKQAKAKEEVARKKSVAAAKTGKPINVKQPEQRLSKPVVDTTVKIQQLKASRDYSFLCDDSALPDLDLVRKTSAARPAQGGLPKSNGHVDQAKPFISKKPPVATAQKGSFVGQNAARPRPSVQPSETSSRSSQLTRTSSQEASRGRSASERTSQQWSKGATSSTPFSGGGPVSGVGRPALKVHTSSQAATERRGVGVPKVNINKVVSHVNLGKQVAKSAGGQRDGTLERANSDVRKRLNLSAANQSTLRSIVDSAERRPQSIDRRPAQSTDRRPGQPTDRRPAQPIDRPSAQPIDRPSAQPSNRRPAQSTARPSTQSVDRHRPQSIGIRPSQATSSRPTGSVEARLVYSTERRPNQVKERQSVAARPAERQPTAFKGPTQGSTIRAPSGVGLKAKAPVLQKRKATQAMDEGRGLSRFDERMRRSGYGYSSEDDDDSFIDDDDVASQNVSKFINNIFRYDPHKYRGDDDFDDRDMVAGFRTIQAEERRSAREARLEDARELKLIEEEERQERLRKSRKKRKQGD